MSDLIIDEPRDKKGHFVLLFCYMMVQLAILPIFERNLILGAGADLTYLVIVFYTVASLGHQRAFWISTVLFSLTILSYILFLFNQDDLMLLVGLNCLSCAFLLVVISRIVTFVLQKDVITIDGVMGGLCVYLLIGAVFTVLYLNIELLQPGSFDFGVHGKDPDFLQMYDLLYFYSFVSLLTIGYGDIVAMSHFAQTITVLEAVIGQFYIVFYVAVVVGLYIYGRLSNIDQPPS